jgi:hypothetical protein
MGRSGVTLLVFLVLAAWAGAQSPGAPVLTAAKRLELHRANRTLLRDLIDSGVKLADAERMPDRAEACQKTAHALGIALRKAAEARDTDRVAELGEHLTAVVRDGLVPILDEGTRTIPAESPDAVRLKAVRVTAVEDLDWARSAIPGSGTGAESDRVRALAGTLDGLREKLK